MPRYIVGPPAHFNADSIGYNADILKKAPNQVGWQELLNKKWKGKVALLKDPGIVMQDVGNALKALGIFKPKDMGNMTKAEIDRVVKVATQYKKAGQFRAYWANFNESVNLMASKEVVVESMWSPAVALLVAQGINVKYAKPPTGYRGWCSAQGIAAHVASDPAKLQACYDYINWMYDGWLGATIMRQGYYIGNGSHAQELDRHQGCGQPGRRHPVQDRRVRLLVQRRPRRPRSARHHGQGRRHQEGLSPRRWLVLAAHRPLLLVEQLLHAGPYQVKRWNDFLSA